MVKRMKRLLAALCVASAAMAAANVKLEAGLDADGARTRPAIMRGHPGVAGGPRPQSRKMATCNCCWRKAI